MSLLSCLKSSTKIVHLEYHFCQRLDFGNFLLKRGHHFLIYSSYSQHRRPLRFFLLAQIRDRCVNKTERCSSQHSSDTTCKNIIMSSQLSLLSIHIFSAAASAFLRLPQLQIQLFFTIFRMGEVALQDLYEFENFDQELPEFTPLRWFMMIYVLF